MEASKIAAAVQSGRADILELWEAVRRFAHDRAYRWYRAMEGRGGMVLEDYIQVAFLALLEALESWDPAAGAFLTWYGLKLKGAFTEAAGMRTQRDKRDPIHHALSLDMPLNGEIGEDLTLADVIEDPRSEEEIEAVAELDYQQRRKQALATALDGLTEDQRRAVVLRQHCHGLTVDQTADRMGITRATARAAEQKGLRLLRHPKNRELRQYA
ncbi:sigma-70 family RNA polymerase sigma factor [Oscillibacter valericigenes]|uniref:Sigma-70 family RNA polymerase sigma factor n=1 Tax=Oscillibacter valericigenes TaxID=351091 RepID=A0ABS2FTX3_9FIRM|nr:sigma-70 family RNA polymerase sigma factor [Oscillibacter valericigenes]MBM6851077.1 sigma-70 family RNA polymerase sigma factor [Oscillibacter valericigenes]